jgi:hypothetical protein
MRSAQTLREGNTTVDKMDRTGGKHVTNGRDFVNNLSCGNYFEDACLYGKITQRSIDKSDSKEERMIRITEGKFHGIGNTKNHHSKLCTTI